MHESKHCLFALALSFGTLGSSQAASENNALQPVTKNVWQQIQNQTETLFFSQPCQEVADNYHCFNYQTLQDYDQPSGAKVKLSFGFRPASGEAKGVLVMHFGGPGGINTTLLAAQLRLNNIPEAILNHFHLIGIDPRGFGESTGADALATCTNPEDPNTHYFNAKGRCDLRQLNHIQKFNTVTAAHDIEALRQQLGIETLNFWGYSYGSKVGGVYAALFPQRVRSLVLDSPISPKSAHSRLVDEQQQGLKNQMEFVRQLSQAADPEHVYKPWPTLKRLDPAIAWTDWIRQLYNEPVIDVTELLDHYADDPYIKAQIAELVFERLPTTLIQKAVYDYEIDDWVDMMSLLTDITQAQAQWLASYKMGQPPTNQQTIEAVLCGDRTASEVQFDRRQVEDLCADYPDFYATEIDFNRIQAPTFLVANEYDPRSPLHWYQQWFEHIPHAYRLQIKNSIEHAGLFNGKRYRNPANLAQADAMAVAFLQQPEAPQWPNRNLVLEAGMEHQMFHEHLISEFQDLDWAAHATHAKAERFYIDVLAELWLLYQNRLERIKQQELAEAIEP